MKPALQSLTSAPLVREYRPRLLIGGELTAASRGAGFWSINPANEENAAYIPTASDADGEDAITAARQAFPGWSARPFEERRKIVLRIAEILRNSSDQFGFFDTIENGNVLSAMRLDALWAADRMEYLSAIAYEIKGNVTNLDGSLRYTQLNPFGVVLRLLPFNHPIASAGVAIAAPLLTGNCVVLKPSPHTSLSALALGEAIASFVPPGVVNIISSFGDELPSFLVGHKDIDRISLTGSIAAGKKVMRAAAERLTPLTLELGGKNPLIIYPDFDISKAAAIALKGMNLKVQGHSCSSTSRVLVHRSRAAEFILSLEPLIARVKVGMPTDPDVEMGAIAFEALYRQCLEYVEIGKSEGARLIVGGGRPHSLPNDRGYFIRPVLFDEVHPTMRIAREEIFGPILSIMTWEDEDEMFEIVNGLEVGLTAVILTNDVSCALRSAKKVKAGYVEINNPVSHAAGSPFGGVQMSGFGREGSIDELLSYIQTKSIGIVGYG